MNPVLQMAINNQQPHSSTTGDIEGLTKKEYIKRKKSKRVVPNKVNSDKDSAKKARKRQTPKTAQPGCSKDVKTDDSACLFCSELYSASHYGEWISVPNAAVGVTRTVPTSVALATLCVTFVDKQNMNSRP
jgi:hypothetical protein